MIDIDIHVSWPRLGVRMYCYTCIYIVSLKGYPLSCYNLRQWHFLVINSIAQVSPSDLIEITIQLHCIVRAVLIELGGSESKLMAFACHCQSNRSRSATYKWIYVPTVVNVIYRISHRR